MSLHDVSDGIFACRVQRRSQHPLSTKHPEFALSVAVVDARRVLRARETTARGAYDMYAITWHLSSSSFSRVCFVTAGAVDLKLSITRVFLLHQKSHECAFYATKTTEKQLLVLEFHTPSSP
jgi:hypothetical protein